MDGDGVVTAIDALLMLQWIAGLVGAEVFACDPSTPIPAHDPSEGCRNPGCPNGPACPIRPIFGCGLAATLTPTQLADIILRTFPTGFVSGTGFTIHETAYAIARAESGRDPSACRWTTTPACECSLGLYQIFWACHPEFPIDSLLDPHANATAALQISNGGLDWTPWAAFTNGSYRSFITEARDAIAIVQTPPPPPPPPEPAPEPPPPEPAPEPPPPEPEPEPEPPPPEPEPEPVGICGDVDGDGVVTAADALLIQQHLAGLITLTPDQLARADVDGDGVVTAIDSLLILQWTAGLVGDEIFACPATR